MAILIRAEDEAVGIVGIGFRMNADNIVHPTNGKNFTLEELQTLVGGYIELVPLTPHWKGVMYVDEEGRLKHSPFNATASAIADQVLYGTALIVTDGEVDSEETD